MQTRVCRLYEKNDIRVETETLNTPAQGEVLIAVGAGGICGSDLHYYHDGGFGPIRVKEPIILGHEIAGTIEAVGEGVTIVKPGERVALNPSRPCGSCEFCTEGRINHCLNMHFYGSAMHMPHTQGGFRDRMIADAAQCESLGAHTSLAEGACAEPLAVCLHAANRAGDLKNKRVLVTGAGPIGALCIAVAKQRGATEIVVTDLQDTVLTIAKQMGATRTINVIKEPEATEHFAKNKGYFDVVFECSAAKAALDTALKSVRALGTIVQVGVSADVPIPLNLIVSKEINLKGTHRFYAEFAQAAKLIDSGTINVKPIVTSTYPLEQAKLAFDAAGDRSKSVKVQLSFAQ